MSVSSVRMTFDSLIFRSVMGVRFVTKISLSFADEFHRSEGLLLSPRHNNIQKSKE